MPGTDPLEITRVVFDELPDLPHLVELPNRGVGADMIGRTAGLLIDLSVDVTPGAGASPTGPGGTSAARSPCSPATSTRWKRWPMATGAR